MGLYAKIKINTSVPGLSIETDIFQGPVRDTVQNIISKENGSPAYEGDSLTITDKDVMARIANDLYAEFKDGALVTIDNVYEDGTANQVDYTFAELLRPCFGRYEKEFVCFEDSPLAPLATRPAVETKNLMAYVSMASRGQVLFGRSIAKIDSITLELQ